MLNKHVRRSSLKNAVPWKNVEKRHFNAEARSPDRKYDILF